MLVVRRQNYDKRVFCCREDMFLSQLERKYCDEMTRRSFKVQESEYKREYERRSGRKGYEEIM